MYKAKAIDTHQQPSQRKNWIGLPRESEKLHRVIKLEAIENKTHHEYKYPAYHIAPMRTLAQQVPSQHQGIRQPNQAQYQCRPTQIRRGYQGCQRIKKRVEKSCKHPGGQTWPLQ